MKNSITKQRNELRSNLKGFLAIIAGQEAKSELDNEDYMVMYILPYAPEEVKSAYWVYRSVDFAVRHKKEIEQEEYQF